MDKPCEKPYGLLRAGFPYVKTLGMRRVTNFPIDLAVGRDGVLYVLCRSAGTAQISRLTLDDDYLGAIGGFGNADGKFESPAALVADRDGNLFVSDDALNRISILDPDGKFLGKWGEGGSNEGQLNRPAGIAFDADENLYVADAMNHRVQKFTRDGAFLLAFGRRGSGPGELDTPWGIAVDGAGDVYVADWRNDRIQKFSPDGQFLGTIGAPGSEDGQLRRPCGVCVDQHFDVYVADTDNNRVQLFDPNGRYVEKFIGDATLSRSARTYLLSNALPNRLREMTNLEPQKRLRGPKSVRVDAEGRMFIPDYGSYRVQVYQKEAILLTPEQIVPPPRSPSLLTV